METKELAKQLGISHQMANRYKAKGMPDTLEDAIAWRRSNVNPFISKTGRIGGNTGVRHQSAMVNKSALIRDKVYSDADKRIFEKTLTDTVPNLYFERCDWLAVAMRDAGVSVTGAEVMEIQDNLFSTYLEEIVWGHFQINSRFELPPISLMRLDSPERKAIIDSLDKILSEEPTPF